MHNFQSLFCQRLYVWGSVPLPIGKVRICELNTHNFRPIFGLNLQKYIISGGHKGHPFFIRECVFRGNHKCTISVPVLTHNFRSFLVLTFWWLQGGSPPFHKKMCNGGTINAQFQPPFCQNLYIYTILEILYLVG